MIEVVIATLIIAIIATVTIIKTGSVREDANHIATYEHLRRLAGVVDEFRAVNGRWPADGYPSHAPSDLLPWCDAADFGESPIDGYYDWNGPGTTSPYFGVAIVRWAGSGNPRVVDMQEIDERFDDGDLTSGHIQRVQVDSRQTLHFIMGVAP